MASASRTHADPERRRTLVATVLLGIGLMAAIDEIVFHQLLAWHHFFDWSTPAFGLLSDGLLHAAELLFLVAGGFMLAEVIRRGTLVAGIAWGGFLAGAGSFQLFDGIVDHKILRLHQVRYVEPLWPYDLAWNLAGLVVLGAGLWLLRRHRTPTPASRA